MDKVPKCPYCGSTYTEVVYFNIGLGEVVRLCKNCYKEFNSLKQDSNE